MNEPISGFPLLGQDNKGLCYKIRDSLSQPIFSLQAGDPFTMTDINDLKYFDDDYLTFEDSIINGCHLDLTLTEL